MDQICKIIRLQETDSTNSYLRQYTGDEAEGMVVAVTEFQTSGRGQGTNKWESERGSNLLFSILFRPKGVTAANQFILSMAFSNALLRALRQYVRGLMKEEAWTLEEQEDVLNAFSVKWPNDIYFRDRKLCGILIENNLQGSSIGRCIIGTGVNVNQQVFRSDAPNPVSLCQIVHVMGDRQLLLQLVLSSFHAEMKLVASHSEQIVSTYLSQLYRRRGFYPYRDSEGVFRAELVTVEPTGLLHLRDSEGRIRKYAFKEVTFVIK